MSQLIENLKGQLIVSCQALPDEPLFKPEGGIMALMAKAASQGGAAAIRAQGIVDIQQIKNTVNLPIIGIIKRSYPGFDSYITPTMQEVDLLVQAGSDIIAIDACEGKRADNLTFEEFFTTVKEKYPHQLFMADISNYGEAVRAEHLGFDLIGTTMSGYTEHTEKTEGPDIELIKKLSNELNVPIIAEGRINSPEDLQAAYQAGADSAVVGSAITRPLEITKRFMAALKD